MNGSPRRDDQSITRQQQDLRTIVVTTRVALTQVHEDERRALVLARAERLLSAIEQRVLADGSDATILAAIERAREEFSG